jgi:hypothetical protein
VSQQCADSPTAAVGRWLKDERLDHGQRLRDVTAETGIPIGRLSLLERGFTRFRPEEVNAIITALRAHHKQATA